jgi:putative hydrolase of the HAD superfamily
MNSKFQAIVFDFDYTLHDRDKTLREFLSKQFDRLLQPLTDISKENYLTETFRVDKIGYTTREEVYEHLITHFQIPISLKTLLDDFKDNAWKKPVLYKGVFDLLERLQKDKIKLGIITNGSERGQSAKLKYSNILPYFDSTLISEIFGEKKPAPAIFNQMLSDLNSPAKKTLFVGDHPEQDIRGANAVGMKTAWIPGHFQWPSEFPACYTYRLQNILDVIEIS